MSFRGACFSLAIAKLIASVSISLRRPNACAVFLPQLGNNLEILFQKMKEDALLMLTTRD